VVSLCVFKKVIDGFVMKPQITRHMTDRQREREREGERKKERKKERGKERKRGKSLRDRIRVFVCVVRC
jgi:hypothetical protein